MSFGIPSKPVYEYSQNITALYWPSRPYVYAAVDLTGLGNHNLSMD